MANWTIVSTIMLLVLALVLVPSPKAASAASIVVNPGGGGNFTTIQAAINNASPGDTIAITTGTYNENLDLSLMGSAIGGATGNLQLVAVDGPGTVNLTGAGAKIAQSGAFNGSLIVNGLNISTTNDDGIRLTAVSNLVIVNSTFDPIGSDFTAHNALELAISSGAPNIVLYQNTFRNIANDAIQIVAQGSAQPTFTIVGNTITDNATHANTTDQAISIEMHGTVNGRATIAGNTLTQLESRAVAIAANQAAQVRAQIVGNTIHTITTVDQAIMAETFNGSTTALLDVTIANNTIQNVSSGNGIMVMMGGVTATPSTPSIVARILGNTLSNIGNNDFDRGILVIPGISGNTNLNGTINVLVENNQETNVAASGLYIFADDSIDIDATVRNNTFTNMVTFPSASEAGFFLRTNNAAARLRLSLINNTATTASPGTNSEIRLLHQTGTFQLEGNAALTVEQNVAADNPTAAGSILVGGTIGIIARGTVVAPAAVNPPLAQDDTANAVSGVATTINVLANDTDPNATAVGLQYFTFTSFRGGTVTRDDNGTPSNLTDDRLVYTSPAGYVGTDTLYYTGTDGTGTDVALVTITVLPQPTATPTNTPNSTNTPTDTPTNTPVPPTNTPTPSPTVQLVTDPCDQTRTALLVLGSGGNDAIAITKAGNNIVRVTVNNVSLGTFSPTGFIIVDGQDGNDTITVDSQVVQPRILYGSAGNDTMRAGNGAGILIGGDGNDNLESGNGRDILIGGDGADTMVNGGNGDDILIAGRTSYDARTAANQQALCGIRSEWVRTDASYQVRIGHLTGATPGGLNGIYYLKGSAPDQTVFDDTSQDRLQGSKGDDWFLLNLSGGTVPDISDRTGSEVATDIE